MTVIERNEIREETKLEIQVMTIQKNNLTETNKKEGKNLRNRNLKGKSKGLSQVRKVKMKNLGKRRNTKRNKHQVTKKARRNDQGKRVKRIDMKVQLRKKSRK